MKKSSEDSIKKFVQIKEKENCRTATTMFKSL
jgi:hypothetical protein